MRIGVAATPSVALPTLDWLLHSQYDLVHVVSTPDQPVGRGRALISSPVSTWAKAHGVPLTTTREREVLEDCFRSVDIVLVIGFGVIFSEHILNAPKFGCINLHFSLLPQWRGAAPVQHALMQGQNALGVTVFKLETGVDTGPVFASNSLEVSSDATYGEVLEQMSELGVSAVKRALEKVVAGESPVPQSGDGISLAPKISRQDAKIDWTKSARDIHNKVRGLNPEPGAWTTWRDEPLQIRRTQVEKSASLLQVGEIALVNGVLLAGCGNNEVLQISTLIPSGRREMPAKDWANGARLQQGATFV